MSVSAERVRISVHTAQVRLVASAFTMPRWVYDELASLTQLTSTLHHKAAGSFHVAFDLDFAPHNITAMLHPARQAR